MDEQLLLWINQGWGSPLLDPFFIWVSQRPTFAFPLLLILLGLSWREWGRDGIKFWLLLVLVIGLGDQFANLLKHWLAQPRPCDVIADLLRQPLRPQGGTCGAGLVGMPSSHALNFFAAASFIAVLARRWHWWGPMLVIATLVTLSRVYLGVHYPSQVLAGALLGIILGGLTAVLALKYLPFAARVAASRSYTGAP